MLENTLTKLFEHNHWANRTLIAVCLELTDEQLDAAPRSVTMGNLRETLTHLVGAQHGYLALLTLPLAERTRLAPAKADWRAAERASSAGLLALTRGETQPYAALLQTRDGYHVEPWVILVQAINHASEHREQICSMLNALGVTPPDMDGWAYGELTHALIPIAP